jgi:DNA ligase-1
MWTSITDGKVHIYSRNSEDNTGKYPDVVANIPKLVKSAVTGGIVLDCEAVAYDREDGIILPFQVSRLPWRASYPL